MQEQSESYVEPRIVDYGDLVEMTAASGLVGAEDGGNKLSIHHSQLLIP